MQNDSTYYNKMITDNS